MISGGSDQEPDFLDVRIYSHGPDPQLYTSLSLRSYTTYILCLFIEHTYKNYLCMVRRFMIKIPKDFSYYTAKLINLGDQTECATTEKAAMIFINTRYYDKYVLCIYI